MGDELDLYHGFFTYYKKSKDLNVSGKVIRNVTNSLCFKWTDGLDEGVDEQFCHPMHPCSDDGLILPVFFEDT